MINDPLGATFKGKWWHDHMIAPEIENRYPLNSQQHELLLFNIVKMIQIEKCHYI